MLRSPERAGEAPPAVLTTTVPKEYVHRAAVSEVFLTGWQRTGADDFTATAQWPRSHSFYRTSRTRYDPLLLCETVRQAPALLMHAAYLVPFGHQMIWTRFRFTANLHALRIERRPAELQLHVTCSEMRRIRGVPAAVTMEFQVMRGSVPLGSATTSFTCHSPAVYRRMRGDRGDAARIFDEASEPAPPLPPSEVGCRFSEDVVLSPSAPPGRPGPWTLRVDTSHPVLFDHPVDHVPGMLLLEAVRQATHALDSKNDMGIPTEMDVEFHRYVEFDSPCTITAEPQPSHPADPRHTVRIRGVQGEATAFTAIAKVGGGC
ncbi:ScbA/BarX family gamma-butyrolactone biosynthesis protein [Streptomyces sp. WAC 04229]|uniref:ScbA/BarX family gamma-butyrolactone biosynthesis protein n=1 Tax=Streptomyces sp. WAC 04229 TaxID=2203206 RepID=UPI00163BA15D|nr:ScbA/BarX family gamma-butyrolactone biosynthesis protein [Streptomyces sp. WAC 04229]